MKFFTAAFQIAEEAEQTMTLQLSLTPNTSGVELGYPSAPCVPDQINTLKSRSCAGVWGDEPASGH
jgi:hypothetical protein